MSHNQSIFILFLLFGLLLYTKTENANDGSNVTGFKGMSPLHSQDNGSTISSMKVYEDNLPTGFNYLDSDDNCTDIILEKDYSLETFGELYANLTVGLNSFVHEVAITDVRTVMFLGNTGAGKSTVVQLLAGDNERLVSREVSEDSGDFIIDDGDKIGTDTIESKTLFPELIFDPETGILLCDSPGFKDTRSPIHEIVASYATKKVIDFSTSLKIALVIPHTSIKKGMYRAEFTSLLKHICDFVKDVDKYGESIFLIANKVENTYIIRKKIPTLVSDETIIEGIVDFLQDTKSSFTKQKETVKDNEFFSKAIAIIDSLLVKSDGVQTRIRILRKPDEVGKVSKIDVLQMERLSIRKMLITNDSFVENKEEDFGYTISEYAKLYIISLFRKMHNYLDESIKIFALYLNRFYTTKLDEDTGLTIDENIKHIKSLKIKIESLSEELRQCSQTNERISVIEGFIKENNLPVCLEFLHKIYMYDDHILNLIHFSELDPRLPIENYKEHFYETVKIVDDYLNYHLMIRNLFQLLTGYRFQRNKDIYNVADIDTWGSPHGRRGLKISEDNFLKFLEKVDLDEFKNVKLNETRLIQLNDIVSITLDSSTITTCSGNYLTIVGGFVLMRDISKYLGSCYFTDTIVVLATHTVYIDIDLDENTIEGRNLIVIAPVWVVTGKRSISVGGKGPEEKPSKAWNGEIGLDGTMGNPGGSFVGIGMHFENAEQLTVSANGGQGQDGQDGGDGVDGSTGYDNWYRRTIDTSQDIYVIYNKGVESTLIKGKPGSRGGDAGAGGYGGPGGKAGNVHIHYLGKVEPKITISKLDGNPGRKGSDGRPGRGGYNGCDKEERIKKHYFLFITVSNSVSTEILPCQRRNPDGSILNYPRKHNFQTPNVHPITTNLCPFFRKLMAYGITNNYFNMVTADTMTNFNAAVKVKLRC